MKRVLVTFVLALTTAAWGQGTTTPQQPAQPAQPAGQQPAASGDQANVPTNQKVIKDPAEYNAYIAALNTTDPAAKGAAMEAFVAQYPNSIVKTALVIKKSLARLIPTSNGQITVPPSPATRPALMCVSPIFASLRSSWAANFVEARMTRL